MKTAYTLQLLSILSAWLLSSWLVLAGKATRDAKIRTDLLQVTLQYPNRFLPYAYLVANGGFVRSLRRKRYIVWV